MEPSAGHPPHPAQSGGILFDKQTVERRLSRFVELCHLSKQMALQGIKYRHPGADRTELLRRFAERLALLREDKWRHYG